ncbi:MAG: CoA transferase [Actinomycetia bacterium]|nr:CoA transferase [Actinomycetes bacterium]
MKPLDGVRVLEFSTMITASFAAMMLAEQGAQVIKVEPLELGDPMRYLGSMKGGFSALFANCNRGKQSLRLDIKSDAGREVIENLAAETDVVLCNYRPGVMNSLGLGPNQLCELNPRLIYAAITGFGIEGPHRDAPAYDPIIQAQAGFAAVQGQGQDGPQFMRSLMCDKVTAYTACHAVTTALYVREKTGRGEKIDLSMMDAGLYFIFPDGFMHQTLLDDDVDHSAPLSEMLYELSPTKDGGVTLSAATPAQQVGLLTAIERLDLFGDERFNSLEKIMANLDEFREELAQEMASFETEDLLSRLHENDVPAARPLGYDEVLAHPQYAANDSIDVTTHPLLGSMHRIKPPARFGGERLQPSADSPDHGQHTARVLADNGYSEDQIAALVEQGVAKPADEVS